MGFTFYTVIKNGVKTVVHSWEACRQLTQGVKGGVKFKGFNNRQEADAWGDQAMSTMPPPKPPKMQDNVTRHKDVLSDAHDAELAIYYADAAYLSMAKFAGVGVWSPSLCWQHHQALDFETHSNQRGEILGLDLAFNHFKLHGRQRFPNGLVVFTDSQWSVNMIQTWPEAWQRKLNDYNTLHPDNPQDQWLGINGKPVKHQDIAKSILSSIEQLRADGMQVSIVWIPRELNKEADALSRGKMLVEREGRLTLC